MSIIWTNQVNQNKWNICLTIVFHFTGLYHRHTSWLIQYYLLLKLPNNSLMSVPFMSNDDVDLRPAYVGSHLEPHLMIILLYFTCWFIEQFVPIASLLSRLKVMCKTLWPDKQFQNQIKLHFCLYKCQKTCSATNKIRAVSVNYHLVLNIDISKFHWLITNWQPHNS